MKSNFVFITLLVVLLVALNVVYCHLCLYTPRQRGPFFNGGAAQNECFRPKAPCGGITFGGKIQATISTQQSFQILVQQNLNHYSIGNPGYLSVAISRKPEPTSQDDFVTLAFVTDYYPFRQWTQTNYTISVDLPSDFGACDHCVVQLRYVPHKPTEPIFHQCSDVTVVTHAIQQVQQQQQQQPIPMQKYTLDNNQTSSNGNFIHALWSDIDDSVSLVQIDTETATITPVAPLKNFVMSDNFKVTWQSAPSGNKIRIMNNIVTADLASNRLFYLVNTDTKFNNPDAFADHLLIVDAKSGEFRVLPIGNNQPLSNLIYVASVKTLYAWSIDTPSGAAWRLFKIDAESGEIQRNSVATIQGDLSVGPYVNYLWSTFDSVNNRLITLARHEDEPLNLDQKLYIVDFNDKYNVTQVSLNSTKYYAFSDMHFNAENNAQLLTLSPGAAPALPVTATSKWSMVRIDLEQKTKPDNHPFTPGEQDFEYLINTPFLQQLGGGIFRGLNQKDQVMYKIVQPAVGRYAILSASTIQPKWSISPLNDALGKTYNLIYLF
jgi:hypothetical protein